MDSDLNQIDIKEVIRKNSLDLGLDEDTYSYILKTMFSHGQEDIEALNSAIENKDVEQIKLLAHRLKGEYANIRLDPLSEQAAEIDRLILAQGEGAIDQIKEHFLQLSSAYKKFKEKITE